jgi:hypothetical protein
MSDAMTDFAALFRAVDFRNLEAGLSWTAAIATAGFLDSHAEK